jgi:Protein of unknown function (DUF1501)
MDLSRRGFLQLGASASMSFLLGPTAWGGPQQQRAKSVIYLWLKGGPSQLETFDPKPGTAIGGPTRAIDTAVRGVQFGSGYPGLAERLDRMALVRSLVTREGEHVRGTYLMRTGFEFNPTVRHPTVSAVAAHELGGRDLEIPPHVSILDNEPPRGGFLGGDYDAFAIRDPREPLPDLVSPVGEERLDERLEGLALLEDGFREGRENRVADAEHESLATRAREMMASEQIEAFDYRQESERTVAAYGDTPFGRGCLTARRLVEVGVPAIQVTLQGWDSHIANFEVHDGLAPALDQGFSALLDDLADRDLLDRTLVICGGEFGRTPRINGLDGRDHWTRGFSALLAGCGVRGGTVIGETDPAGEADPTQPVDPSDFYASVYQALEVDAGQWFVTDVGRPIQLNEGTPIPGLLEG